MQSSVISSSCTGQPALCIRRRGALLPLLRSLNSPLRHLHETSSRRQAAVNGKEELPLSPLEAQEKNHKLLVKLMDDFAIAKAKGLIKDGFEGMENEEEDEDGEWVVWSSEEKTNELTDKEGEDCVIKPSLEGSQSSEAKLSSSISSTLSSPPLDSPLSAGALFPQLGPLMTDEGSLIDLNQVLESSGIVIFGYFRANTPGCSNQASAMRDNLEEIEKAGRGYRVFGLSPDSPKVQARWKNKLSLGFTLLCDPNKEALTALGMLKEDTGGMLRSHIIVEKGGKIELVEYGVGPKTSVKSVLSFAKSRIMQERLQSTYQ